MIWPLGYIQQREQVLSHVAQCRQLIAVVIFYSYIEMYNEVVTYFSSKKFAFENLALTRYIACSTGCNKESRHSEVAAIKLAAVCCINLTARNASNK